MKKQNDRRREVIAVVQIESIRLVKMKAETRIRSSEDVKGVTLKVRTSTSVNEQRPDGTFCVLTLVDTQLIPEGGKEKPAVTIEAGFELRYKLPSGFATSSDELSYFAKTNGVYNAWPYWRELIQNTLVRMNLPPVVLPLLRIGGQGTQSEEEKPGARTKN
jgi:hypothetical protein